MDYHQLLKDVFTLKFSSLKLRFHKLRAILQRIIYTQKNKTEEEIRSIPVIINNRNRFTYMLKLISWLENAGIKNIYIIDNDSTYPPLLDFYEKTHYKVFRLKDNIGHLAFWKTGIYKKFKKDYYIYTDADILPVDECPQDAIKYFYLMLQKYKGIEKIGFALKIDDLPDHYENKGKVIEWEQKFWTKKIEENIYDAPIDTTFALYRPFTDGEKWAAKAYRTGGSCIARHLPWYENSAKPAQEDIFYANNVKEGASHWIPIKREA